MLRSHASGSIAMTLALAMFLAVHGLIHISYLLFFHPWLVVAS